MRPKAARRFAFAVAFLLVAIGASAQTTYTWSGSGSWATSTNWSPTRTTPAANDILVFNTGTTLTVTAVPTQTIGKLQVTNSTALTLQPAATATTLTISGGSGALSVAAGSQLNISGTNTLTLNLPTGSNGTVSGAMTFTNAAHKLTAADASGITFQSGAAFTAGTGFSSNAFGTTNLNSVVFASGSRYNFIAGANPFGAAAPSSVLVFQTGSTYSQQSSTAPSLSGRTYANFELTTGSIAPSGGSAVSIDNLSILGGTFTWAMTGTPGHSIKGNISVSAGGTLIFNPATAGTVNLNGSAAQTITNSGTLTINSANQTINVNNANGVTLASNVTVSAGALTLTSGTINTGANTLAIGSSASVTRTSGYVVGNLKKTYAAIGSKTIEVGTANGYSPIIANVTAGTFPADITVVATQSAQPNVTAGTSIQRYWTLTTNNISTADLTFQYLAGDVQGTEASYQAVRVTGGTPTYIPATIDTVNHTAAVTGITSFPTDWTVGASPDTTPPSVTSVTVPANGSYGTGTNLDFNVNFSETVLVTGTPRIPITLNTGGTVYANYVSGSNSSSLLFRYTVASGNDDPDGIVVGTDYDTNGGSIKDLAGNNGITTLNNVGSTTGVLVETTPPNVVSVTLAGASPTNASSVDFTVTFSEPVTGVNAADFALTTSGVTGTSITNVAGSGATRTVTVNTGSGDGTIRLDVLNDGSIKDLAGNVLSSGFTGGDTYSIDKTAPSVTSINRATASPTNASSVDFTVTFSESVTGVASNDFSILMSGVSGATIANVAGSGSIYTVTVNTGSGDGTLRVDFLGSASDSAGNATSGAFTSGQSYAIDKTAPSVVSITRNGSATTSAQSVGFTVTFSESVTGVDAADFVLTTTGLTAPSITNVTGSGTTYIVTADTGTGNGTLRLDLDGAASISDAAGNGPAAFTSGEVYTIDKSSPSVVSITRNGPNPTHNASVHFNVTFSTNVTGVDTSDFTLTTTGVSGATVSNVSGSGSTYDITVSGISGDGTVRLDLVDDDSILAVSNSNPLGGSGAGNGNFNTGETYSIDQTPPVVQSIVRADANPTTAGTVHFTVTYSEVVTGVSAQDWSLTTSGVTGASVTATNGSGTTYDVTVNTGSGDGTIRLDVVTGGTVIDTAGNLLPAGFNTGEVYTIDRTSPSVQSIARANTNPTSAASVDFTVTFSEAVTGVDSSDFTLAASGVSGASISGVSGSGSSYTVSVSTGTGSGTIGLNLVDDDTIADGAANKLGGTGNGNGDFTGEVYTVQKLPFAPTSLTAGGGNNTVHLTWNAANGASTYNIKRGTTSNGETTFITGVGGTTYDDSTAVNGTQYFYKVSGSNTVGEGPDSNEASATPQAPLPGPSPVNVAVGSARVVLSWTAVGGASSYNVKRGTSTGNYTTTTNVPVPTFTDTTVTNGTTYYYIVTSVSSAEGTASPEVTATPNTPNNLGVVFSEVYGGGGNSGATYKNDFMELFNRGTQTVDLTGWSVQYSSATGTFTNVTNLSGTIAPGHYFLVQESAGAGGTTNLPTPDVIGAIAMGATAGKVAVTGQTAQLTSTCTGSVIADLVGYGATANCSETSPTAAPANATAVLRANAGCTDTNNNSADFTVGPPNPRNSATAVNVCGASNTPPVINAPSNPITTVNQDAAPFTVQLTGTDDNNVFNWSATPGTGVSSVIVSNGQGTGTVTYTVSLIAAYNGIATFTATLSDNVNTAVNQTVNIQVNSASGNNAPVIAAPANPITSVAQDAAPFTVQLNGTDDGGIYNWSATPGNGISSVNVTGGQGTSTVTYTVSLNAAFNGTASFTASLSDNVNPAATQIVNINVTAAGGAPNHLVISQFYGGGGNSGATFQNDYVEIFNPTASPVNISGWTLQYAAATSTSSPANIAPLGGIVGPGQYYLVQLASGGVAGPPPLPYPPDATGGINMSATSGKIALVSNGNPLSGTCGSALADPDLVDYVGYGSANCSEGSQNAPTGSNTLALFRKNGGSTDTNNNQNDFVTGTPAPRQPQPVQEVGPAVVSTDPSTNSTIAPRDANIVVNFTEPVDAIGNWYDINCVTTGNHNSATTADRGDFWVIIPNVNFVAGEQCTVTIFAAQVHDRDTDDSVPGTDTLPADYTWSFTVATGAAPPYPASVHLTMGNPSNAVTDINVPNNYLMSKPEMAISYNRDFGRPNWVSWHLTDEWNGSLPRNDTFRADPAVPPTWYRVLGSDFSFSGFDRGHMTPNADRDNQNSIPINQATYLMTNMVAQAPDNNQGPWANFENYLRSLLPADELYIVSGPYGVGGTGSNGFAMTIDSGHVTVPEKTWKVVLVLPKATGDDVARVTAQTRTIAVIMPNTQGIRTNDPNDWQTYITTVDAVEALTGYDFFSNVPTAIQASIEGGTNGTNVPGAGDESVTTAEDNAAPITLQAVSPSNGTLTYTIQSNPSHGQLTGSGASRTYTPAPDFNGTDSFTYYANDGTANTNTATVTITVTAVNDSPVAVDDSKSTSANTQLVFNAGDLTTNDSAGPSNESSQTLTVSSVTGTVSTHGTVSLSNGQVTYSPDLNYSGAASFTYSVCDNGSPSLCANATVNVAIAPLAITHFGITGPSSPGVGSTFSITVSALDGSNAVVTGYRGTVHFTSSGASLTLPADYTFTAGDNGAHSFNVTANATGASTINVADGSLTGSFNLNVICPVPNPVAGVVTAPAGICATSTGNAASVLAANGATTYTWTAGNATITSGQGTPNITFTAGSSGVASFTVNAASADGCPVATYSGQSTIFAAPAATIAAASQITVCPNTDEVINVMLTGAAPFTLHWSDGVTETVNSNTTSRTMSFTTSTTISITSIQDAHCTTGTASNSVHVNVNAPPVITQQPQSTSIPIGGNTTLTVTATGTGVSYYWYEGNVGDTTTLVANGTSTFTTPHLHDATKYWVRVFTNCGFVDSNQVTVSVFIPSRHRGASH